MKKSLSIALMLVVGLFAGTLSGARSNDPLGVAVSPHTLQLSMDQGGRVTVHTSIPFAAVDRATVRLNGLDAQGTWADARGELVAGFDEAAVKAIVEVPATTLTLTGTYAAGGDFAGSDTVQVMP